MSLLEIGIPLKIIYDKPSFLKLLITSIDVAGNGGEIQWCFSQVKGSVEEEVADGRSCQIIFN